VLAGTVEACDGADHEALSRASLALEKLAHGALALERLSLLQQQEQEQAVLKKTRLG